MGFGVPPKGKYIFGMVKVGDKGQIVIPAKARKIFEINPGDNLIVLGDEGQGIIEKSQGINLESGHVPGTEFFLWDDDVIVGLFRIRHYLCEALIHGAGHIGYGIKKEYRGRGYASEGLKLTIEKAWTIIPEDEIYMSVHKDNPASLKAQMKNGAYIHHEDDVEYYTRIKRSL